MLVFFSVKGGRGERVGEVLGERGRFEELGARARKTVIERYDLKTVCLPKQMAMVDALLGGKARKAGKRSRRGNPVIQSSELPKLATT